MAEKVNFEMALKSLEGIVERLQNGDCTLEESIVLFEKGMADVKICREALSEAEMKITTLNEV